MKTTRTTDRCACLRSWDRGSAVEIVRQGLEQAQANHNDYVLIDTAGRLQIDELLMNELRDVKKLAQPNEILLVVDAMIGQEAANIAREFNAQLEVTGVIYQD